MTIFELNNVIKVCDINLSSDNNTKSLWDINWCENLNPSLLTQDNGRCYFIVVNDIIFKIGYSDSKNGIKNTIMSYKLSGNSGRPSDRTHGIHLLITEELLNNNRVEFYFTYLNEIVYEMVNSFGIIEKVKTTISGKVLEKSNLTSYYNIVGSLPKWNLQEKNESWPSYIQESRNNLLNGECMTIDKLLKIIR